MIKSSHNIDIQWPRWLLISQTKDTQVYDMKYDKNTL